jgi:hypothetical protein
MNTVPSLSGKVKLITTLAILLILVVVVGGWLLILKPFEPSLSPYQAENGLFGYMDNSGKIVISPQFEFARPFVNDSAVIYQNKKAGLINKTGKVVIPPIYVDLLLSKEGLITAVSDQPCDVEMSGCFKHGFIDLNGNTIIPPKYSIEEGMDYWSEEPKFSEGLAKVLLVNSDYSREYLYIDKQGNEVLKPQYEGMGDFKEGLAVVVKNEKFGFINKQGELVVPLEYESASDFSEGLALVKKGGKYGYIDKSGNVKIHFQFPDAYSFHESLARVVVGQCQDEHDNYINGGCSYGFINTSGAFEINPILQYPYSNESKNYHDELDWFGDSFDFHNGLALVKQGNKFGFIDKKGNYVIPTVLDMFPGKFQSSLLQVSHSSFYNNKGVVISLAGTSINDSKDEGKETSTEISASQHSSPNLLKQMATLITQNPWKEVAELKEGGKFLLNTRDITYYKDGASFWILYDYKFPIYFGRETKYNLHHMLVNCNSGFMTSVGVMSCNSNKDCWVSHAGADYWGSKIQNRGTAAGLKDIVCEEWQSSPKQGINIFQEYFNKATFSYARNELPEPLPEF